MCVGEIAVQSDSKVEMIFNIFFCSANTYESKKRIVVYFYISLSNIGVETEIRTGTMAVSRKNFCFVVRPERHLTATLTAPDNSQKSCEVTLLCVHVAKVQWNYHFTPEGMQANVKSEEFNRNSVTEIYNY